MSSVVPYYGHSENHSLASEAFPTQANLRASSSAKSFAALLFQRTPSLNDTLSRSKISQDLELADLHSNIKAAIKSSLTVTGISPKLLEANYKRWTHRIFKGDLKKGYKKQYLTFVRELKEQYPEASKRVIKKNASQLCLLSVAQNCEALVAICQDGGKEFVRSFGKGLKNTEILSFALDYGARFLYLSAAALLSYLVLQVYDQDGFFTSRYHMKSEQAKSLSFAQELRDMGDEKGAQIFEQPDALNQMRTETYRAFGFSEDQFERLNEQKPKIKNIVAYSRASKGLHVPLFGQIYIGGTEESVEGDSCLATYDEYRRILEFHGQVREHVVAHEMAHNVITVAGSNSLFNQNLELSALDVLEEGAARYVEDQQPRIGLLVETNFALFNVLLGHDSQSTDFNPNEQFEKGKLIFGAAFIDQESYDPVKEKLNAINGPGTFERVVVDSFKTRGGNIRLLAAILFEFETAGYDIEEVLGAWSPLFKRNGMLSSETNSIVVELAVESVQTDRLFTAKSYAESNEEKELASEAYRNELILEIYNKYRGTKTGDLFGAVLTDYLYSYSRQVSPEQQLLAQRIAEDTVTSGRQGYWRLAAQKHLVEHGRFASVTELERLAEDIKRECPKQAWYIDTLLRYRDPTQSALTQN